MNDLVELYAYSPYLHEPGTAVTYLISLEDLSQSLLKLVSSSLDVASAGVLEHYYRAGNGFRSNVYVSRSPDSGWIFILVLWASWFMATALSGLMNSSRLQNMTSRPITHRSALIGTYTIFQQVTLCSTLRLSSDCRHEDSFIDDLR